MGRGQRSVTEVALGTSYPPVGCRSSKQVIKKRCLMSRFADTSAFAEFRVCGCVLGLFAVATFLTGCKKEHAAAPPRPAIPIVVGKVTQKHMPVQVTAIGNVEAYATISIRSQVAGELLDVHFKEGDFVSKGQKLFTIDPRSYQAALDQAQAVLARDKAVAENSHSQAARYKQLFDAGIGTREQADSFATSADAADATLRSDEAAIQTAKLNLEYCTIYSPLNGRTGAVMVKPGNLIKASDVPIVVINQVTPIFVNFTVPQQYLTDVKKHMAGGDLHVAASIPEDSGTGEIGTLTFVDNAVDTTTGTIHMRGTFANTQNRLWPGLFVNTVLTLSDEANAVVVPAQAIVAGQNGSTVFVVKPNNTVEQRPVVSGRTIESETVVTKGLAPGETVVVDGSVNLTPGARIEVKNGPNEADSSASPQDAQRDSKQP